MNWSYGDIDSASALDETAGVSVRVGTVAECVEALSKRLTLVSVPILCALAWSVSHGLESVGEEVGEAVLREWEELVSGLRADPSSVADRVDWVAKKRVVDAYADRHDLPPGEVAEVEEVLALRVGLRAATTDLLDHLAAVPGRSARW